MRKTIFSFIAILSILFISCKKDKPEEITADIYLVAYEGSKLEGKVFGCNDILVPVPKTIKVEKNNVAAVLDELLQTKDSGELKNFVKGPGLILYQVTISNGVADVYLKGDFMINVPCDIQRIREQLYETAKQFPDVKKVKFFINDQTLESYLKIAAKGFKL